ncbi:cell surface protein [Staphylotrichum tortipilum]|uniref:Cell surface protein n=1 Tax=Staphylotrichum tortipilum TaxID=2831512 RepID=A0AAN6MKA1_9PEZI|nr:cell surface protein [Staphylotrichum longicolle]
MLPNALFLLTLALAPLATAHGKVTVVRGNAGGNGTALAIRGAIVPNTGPNSKTEVDTTVFPSTTLSTRGLGRTTGSGKNTLGMLVQAMALSGSVLPQLTPGGNLSGTFHVVTADGAGPIQAVLDPSATGDFRGGVVLNVVEQIPGVGGNFVGEGTGNGKKQTRGGLWERATSAVGGLGRRGAANVNKSFGFVFSVPEGTKCTGTVAGMEGVCLVKIANANKAGPFGGVVPVQMAAAGGGKAAACARAFVA